MGLVFLIVSTAIFGRAVLYWTGEARMSLRVIVPLALIATGPVTLCRFTQNMTAAVWLWSLLMTIGVALLWRATPPTKDRPPASISLPRWAFVCAAVIAVLVSIGAFGTNLWDEFNGHFPLATVISRGIAPPEHALYPGAPFPYHYGFDAVAGVIMATTGAPANVGLDVVSIACFLALLLAARDVGDRLGGPRAAALAVVLVPLGGALVLLFLYQDMGTLKLSWDAIPPHWRAVVPPPVISNFYQHPQGIGMPVSLAVLLLFDQREDPRGRWRRVAVGVVLLGLLSLCQIVFFGIIGLALGVALLLRRGPIGARLLEVTALLASLALAYALGGFFEAETSSKRSFSTAALSFFKEPSLAKEVLRQVMLLGLPILGLFYGAFALRRRTVLSAALTAAAAWALVIPNAVTYARSWDMVKFFGVSAFFLNVLFAGFLAQIRFARHRALVAVLVLIAIAGPSLFLVRVSVLNGFLGVPRFHFPGPSRAAVEAAEQLLPHMESPRDPVFATNIKFSLSGGLLTPGFDWRLYGEGFLIDHKKMDRLRRHYNIVRRDLSAPDLQALGIKFLLLYDTDKNAFSKRGKAALADTSRFEELFKTTDGPQPLTAYRVLGPNHSAR